MLQCIRNTGFLWLEVLAVHHRESACRFRLFYVALLRYVHPKVAIASTYLIPWLLVTLSHSLLAHTSD